MNQKCDAAGLVSGEFIFSRLYLFFFPARHVCRSSTRSTQSVRRHCGRYRAAKPIASTIIGCLNPPTMPVLRGPPKTPWESSPALGITAMQVRCCEPPCHRVPMLVLVLVLFGLCRSPKSLQGMQSHISGPPPWAKSTRDPTPPGIEPATSAFNTRTPGQQGMASGSSFFRTRAGIIIQ